MTAPDIYAEEAAEWLKKAATSIEEGAEGFAQAEALVAIGHNLTSIGQTLGFILDIIEPAPKDPSDD